MKKLAIILLSLVLCTSLFAAAAPETATSSIKTVVPGTLTVATSPDFAPYEFYAIDANGKPTLAGFDISLAQYVADYMGLKLDVIPMDFDGILGELVAGTVDIGLSGFTKTAEREEIVDFSDVYYTASHSFVVLNENASKYTSLENLNNPGIKVGAQTGSIHVGLAEEFSKDGDIVLLSKVTDIVAEILAGTLDGGYIQTEVAEAYQKNYPQLNIIMEVPYDSAGILVAVPKGKADFMAKLNEAIQECLKTGTFAQYVADANELAGGEIYEGLLN